MYAYVAAHRTKDRKYGNPYLKWCKYTVPQCTSAADTEQIKVSLTNSARYNKTGTMSCWSQPTHWHETNQYLVSKQSRKQITRKQITRTMTCSKSTANASGSWRRNDTEGICWWHWRDHYVVKTYVMTSKH